MGAFYSSHPTIFLASCLSPSVYGPACIQKGPDFLETVQFRALRALCFPAGPVENPWHSRVKGSIAVTRLLMTAVQNLTPWSMNEARKGGISPEEGGNLRVSSR